MEDAKTLQDAALSEILAIVEDTEGLMADPFYSAESKFETCTMQDFRQIYENHIELCRLVRVLHEHLTDGGNLPIEWEE